MLIIGVLAIYVPVWATSESMSGIEYVEGLSYEEQRTDQVMSMQLMTKSQKSQELQIKAGGRQKLTVSLGKYRITYYCSCTKCCGKDDGITATGTKATADRTIAVDPKVIPYGSRIIIDGKEYVAEDTGGFKAKTIDMYVENHQEALNRGVDTIEVFMVQ